MRRSPLHEALIDLLAAILIVACFLAVVGVAVETADMNRRLDALEAVCGCPEEFAP